MRAWLLESVLAVTIATLLVIAAIAALPSAPAIDAIGTTSWSDNFLSLLRVVASGEFDYSVQLQADIGSEVVRASIKSLTIIGVTILVVLTIGVPLGIAAVTQPQQVMVRYTRRLIDAISNVPVLVWGSLVYLVAARTFAILREDTGLIRVLLFAALVLAFSDHLLSDVLQRVESGTREILREPYMRIARTARLGERRHLLQSLVTPVATLVASRAVFLISGAIVAELVFEVHGLGFLVKAGIQDPSTENRRVVLAASLALIAITLVFRLLERGIVALADRRTLR